MRRGCRGAFQRACLLAALLAANCATPIAPRPAPPPAPMLNEATHLVVTAAPGAVRAALGEALAARHGITFVAAWPLQAIARDCLVFEVAPAQLDRAEAALGADPRVIAVQRMMRFESATVPAPGGTAQPNLVAIGAPRAHALSQGAGVTVAVVDTGVAAEHPDLAGRVTIRDFVEDGRPPGTERHGTAVAGVIAANGTLLGVAPRARLLALRACWQRPEGTGGLCNTVSLARALNFAALAGVQVVNVSLTGPPDPLLARLVGAVAASGALIVAAARPGEVAFPASHPQVVAAGERPGPGVAVTAPAREVASLAPGNSYDLFSGASIAAAHVSGAAALLRATRPSLGREAAGEALARSMRLDACRLVADDAAFCAE